MIPRLDASRLARIAQAFSRRTILPDGFTLGIASARDLDALTGVAKACFAYDTPSRSELRYFLTTAHAAVFVIRRAGGAIVGYTLIEANRRTLTLYNNTTCLLPECRGLGLGSVFYALKRQLPELLGYRRIVAHAAVDNALSLGLFAKQGFVITDRLSPYYDDGRDAYKLCFDAGLRPGGRAARHPPA